MSPAQSIDDWRLDRPVTALLRHRRDAAPDAVAIVEGGNHKTYAELCRESGRLARSFAGSPAAKHGAVILFVESKTDAALGMVAAMMAGLSSVVATSPQQLRAILPVFPGALVVLRSATMPAPAALNRDAPHPFLDLSAPHKHWPTPCDPESDPPSSATAVIALTSGSTGRPKAVRHPHRSLMNQVRNYTRNAGLSSVDRIAVIAPLHSVTGQSSLLAALLNGATACAYNIERDGIDSFEEWLLEERVTVMHATPTVYRSLAKTAGENGTVFSSLRVARIGGEAVSASDLAEIRALTAPECLIYIGYGCSEMGTMTRLVVDHEASKDVDFSEGTPVGTPCENIAISICGPSGEVLPEQKVGEVVVTSEYLTTGYWGAEEATERAYRVGSGGSRSYHTGDLGMLRDGMLILVGRADRQVKVRGHRIELDAVEQQLSAIPGFGNVVVEAVATTVNGSPPTTRLHAFLTPQLPELMNARALRRATVASEMSPAMVPARFVILDTMPHTGTGKVDRAALRRLAGEDMRRNGIAPESDMEEWLLTLWKSLMHRDDFGTTDDYFELGGDSMTAVRIFHEIFHRFGARLPVSVLLEASTVVELAARIETAKPAHNKNAKVAPAGGLLLTLGNQGGRPPLFLIHDIGGNVLNYRRLAQELGSDQPVYGIRSPALDGWHRGLQEPPESLEALAALYIAEVTHACGDRPVALAGLSFGGKVAFEMARQLVAVGRPVVFLGLFDTRLEMSDLRPDTERRRLESAFRTFGYQCRRCLYHLRRWASGDTGSNYLNERVRKRRKKSRASGDAGPSEAGVAARDQLSPEQKAAAWHRGLGRIWQPQPCSVPVHYFAAREPTLRGPFDNLANWRHIAKGGIDVTMVQGNHISLLEDPHVPGLAAAVARSLDACTADPRQPGGSTQGMPPEVPATIDPGDAVALAS